MAKDIADDIATAFVDEIVADEVQKAIEAGGPAMAGFSPDELALDVRDAQRDAEEVRDELRAIAVGLFTGYDRVHRFGQAAVASARTNREKAAVRGEIADARVKTEYALKAAIRRSYKGMFQNGKVLGYNVRGPDKAERKFLERLRREEFVFVKRFLDDIEQGRCKMPVEDRAALYGNAANEAMWFGFVYADQSPDRYLRWVLSDEEACPDCLYLAGQGMAQGFDNPNAELQLGGRWGNGVYSAQELALLAVVPQSGKLRCTTRCRCHLEETGKPRRAPVGKVQRKPFKSLAPKPVQAQYEKRRKRQETKRVRRGGTVVRKGVLSDWPIV